MSFHLFAVFSLLSPTLGLAIKRDDAGTGDPFENSGREILWGDSGPVYQDVQQGTIGNCWLDAVAASLAYAQPNVLRDAIVDQNNNAGEVKVTLWDKKVKKEYTVTKPIMGDWIQSNSVGPSIDGGHMPNDWPAVVVEAFYAFSADATDLSIHTDLNGGIPGTALEAFLGPYFQAQWTPLQNAKTDDIWNILNNVKLSATTSVTPSLGGEYLDNGLPQSHAYSVLDANRDTGIITLRNPWGMVSQTDTHDITDKGYGVFEISYDNWKKYFIDLTTGVATSDSILNLSGPLTNTVIHGSGSKTVIHKERSIQ